MSGLMEQSVARATQSKEPGGIARFWYNAAIRAIVVQALILIVLAVMVTWFTNNAIDNMARVGITAGYSFLEKPANFAIGETLIDYASTDSYGRAVLVGLLNTLKVAAIACVLATVFGTLLGVLRLSTNPLLRGLVQAYVEAIRNVPLLLQLFFWYSVVLTLFPGPRAALSPLPGVFLSNRGVLVPNVLTENGALWAWGFAVIIAGWVALALFARWRFRNAGRPTKIWPYAVALPIIVPLIIAFPLGDTLSLDFPTLKGFNFVGGLALSPEFFALLTGLTLYSSAFISEVVRAGLQNVSRGQTEAARSLGLSWGQTMRLIILPQALRVIIPPLTSIYLALTKNSSLAVAIGYPDLVSVVNTVMNQTGHAVETVAILMGTYLTISLGISLFMNWYNRAVAIKET